MGTYGNDVTVGVKRFPIVSSGHLPDLTLFDWSQ